MKTLIVPRNEDMMWGMLRVFSDSALRPLAPLNFPVEMRILLDQMEAVYTKQTNRKLSDNADGFLTFFSASPPDMPIHKILTRAIQV